MTALENTELTPLFEETARASGQPRAAVVATNLVVYTDRRAYRFDYSAEARRPNRSSDEVIYAVRFAYPSRGEGGPDAEQAIVQSHFTGLRRLDGHPVHVALDLVQIRAG